MYTLPLSLTKKISSCKSFPTPLEKILHTSGWPVWLKLEKETPSGSHKYRPALKVVERLRRRGIIGNKTIPCTLVISSSGNAAYALAMLTSSLHVSVKVFTDCLSPYEMVDRLREFDHVEIEIIDKPDKTGSHIIARKQALQKYLSENPKAIEIDQYQNSDWGCGYFSLFSEIEAQAAQVGALIIPTGTGATLRSAVQYKLKNFRRWKIFAADALGSALFGIPSGTRTFSGYGNGGKTMWIDQSSEYIQPVKVSDDEVVRASQFLLGCGYFLGPSSAATFASFEKLIQSDLLPHSGAVMLVMPDSGEWYNSTLYNEDFLIKHGFGGIVAGSSI